MKDGNGGEKSFTKRRASGPINVRLVRLIAECRLKSSRYKTRRHNRWACLTERQGR